MENQNKEQSMSTPKNGDRRSPELDPPPIDGDNGVHQTPKISVYEQTREERIRANLERMQKLGLKELSHNLSHTNKPTKQQRRSYTKFSERPQLSSPRRRSSRLQKMEPPSYAEGRNSKRDVLEDDERVNRRAGGEPEVYTEEQVKRLGGTERTWTLFVDGYGKDGRRIYDPINGKTCHQCRQKTLGHRTHCSSCQGVRGQFCGDCLYMRYGEHVLEALEDPNWICPVCRGICNCSFCRQSKGYAPTGILYRKISALGYKSVAHYLMQTQPQKTSVANNSSVPPSQESDKSSLALSNTEEAATKEPCEIIHQQDTPAEQPRPEEPEPGSETPVWNSEKKRSVCPSESEVDRDYAKFTSATPPISEGRKESELKSEQEKDTSVTNSEAGQRRLSRRLNLSYDHTEAGITTANEGKPSDDHHNEDNKMLSNPESGQRRRSSRRLYASDDHNELEKTMVKEGKPSGGTIINQAAAPSPDSIGARLRQRRRLGA